MLSTGQSTIARAIELLLRLLKNALTRRRAPARLNALAMEHYNRGEFDKAECYFREVVPQMPAEVTAWTNLAATLLAQDKYAEAVTILTQAAELDPGSADIHHNLGATYRQLSNNDRAIEHYRRAISLNPDLDAAHAGLINSFLNCCDWDEVDLWLADFAAYRSGRLAREWMPRIDPFCALSVLPGPVVKEMAIAYAARIARSISAQPAAAPEIGTGRRAGRKLRIGYVSADFHSHATAHLTFNLYASHDRDKFEVFAYSMGPDDGSEFRKHIAQTCDRFVDVRWETAERTASRIKADGIDILVDMKGYTGNNRAAIFAHRPAPIQVNYLGYPGTSGAGFIDYFVSDPVATPPGYEKDFTEKLAYLPDSYQVTDDRQPISAEPCSRTDFQLPEHAFVYCSFNRLSKIDRVIFSTWMEILRHAPNSVLWLMQEDDRARTNLQREAASRGIDPQRIIFARKLDKPAHLARHRLADLFLDTLICNAHTGASDALWAGLPLLTCPGDTFIRRVAASVLHAAGLSELIAHDLTEYETLAVRLAIDENLLASVKRKLAASRSTCRLFDSSRYVRNLETAYIKMHEQHQSGRLPESFFV